MKNVVYTLIAIGLMQGCTSFDVDYVGPSEGPKATLTIKSELGGGNEQIIFHGENVCEFEGAKFVGLLNSLAIGQERHEELKIEVQANKQVSLSTPQFDVTKYNPRNLEISYCQPILSFNPKDGIDYLAVFNWCTAQLYKVEDNGELTLDSSGKLNDSCVPTTQNMGTPGKSFFLKGK